MTKRFKLLEEDVRKARDPPIFFSCSHKDFTSAQESSVTFDREYYSRRNVWTQEGGMDIPSGVFTAPYPGTYTFTYSVEASNDYDDAYVQIYLRKNKENIPESYH